jgi:hypothetical protein
VLGAKRPWAQPLSALKHTKARFEGWAILAALPLALWLVGCAGSTPPAEASVGGDAEIASLHARKCGKCHTPPEPKTRSREKLEAAFARHKGRVHLNQAQWAGMIDYLAASVGTAERQER